MPSDRLAKVLKLAGELPEEERVELATATLIPWDEAREMVRRDE